MVVSVCNVPLDTISVAGGPRSDREWGVAKNVVTLAALVGIALLGQRVIATPQFLQKLTGQATFFTSSFTPGLQVGVAVGAGLTGLSVFLMVLSPSFDSGFDARKDKSLLNRLGALAVSFGGVSLLVGLAVGVHFGIHTALRRIDIAPGLFSALAGLSVGVYCVSESFELASNVSTLSSAKEGGPTAIEVWRKRLGA